MRRLAAAGRAGAVARQRLTRRLSEQRGSQLIEFAALFPMVILTILIIWQFALGAYTMVVAHAAARDGARAAASDDDWRLAAERSADGFQILVDDPEYSDLGFGPAVTVRVRVRVPLAPLPFLRDRRLYVQSEATMPVG